MVQARMTEFCQSVKNTPSQLFQPSGDAGSGDAATARTCWLRSMGCADSLSEHEHGEYGEHDNSEHEEHAEHEHGKHEHGHEHGEHGQSAAHQHGEHEQHTERAEHPSGRARHARGIS